METIKKLFLALMLVLVLAGGLWAQDFASLDIINKFNLAWYMDDLLGYVYESHGCLHFYPADIYLLTHTIPDGIPLRIKKYGVGESELGFAAGSVPSLTKITNSQEDLARYRQTFRSATTEVVVYPSLNKLFIMVAGVPYAQVKALAGPPENLLMAFEVKKGQPTTWDFMLTTPTDPGNYRILRSTIHYVSNAYYQNTIVPFGAWMIKQDGRWLFAENKQWLKAPNNIIADLQLPEAERQYNYYDLKQNTQGEVVSARWAGHDFGRDVLLWTKDGKDYYPEMGYAAGELVFEQIILVKDLVYLLTVPGADDFDACMAQNENFKFYKELADFIRSQGRQAPVGVRPDLISYYRLYRGLELTDADYRNMSDQAVQAFQEYQQNRLPRERFGRRRALGLVQFLKTNALVIEKQAYWYDKIKKDWPGWQDLRVKLREDFQRMGVLSLANRQNVLEQWWNERLEFRRAAPPGFAKYLGELSFAVQFQANDETTVFTEREKAEMLKLIEQISSEEAEDVPLYSVQALNDYNFGLLLNDILGDLYKSHGCLHVTPRDSYFLYDLLPKGAPVVIHPYAQKLEEGRLKDVPDLAHLVNFKDDLVKLREKFSAKEKVAVAVYPSAGLWLIYLDGKPFAKLSVKGGPQSKFYLLQDRDKKGRPIFEDHLAYPTTPGSLRIFHKVEDYVSNTYYETTLVPQGAQIRKLDGKWKFLDKKSKWQPVTRSIAQDLGAVPAQRRYDYYDINLNASGEALSLRWGSQPFGRYALQTTKDGKIPFPELIHSSGSLIMEERQLISDLIKILAAPQDTLEECLPYSENFELYKVCYEFGQNPARPDLIGELEAANYKLYFDLPLTSEEAAALPPDALIANKIIKNKGPLTNAEIKVLLDEGIAYKRNRELKINMEKVLGLQFDTYQYVVQIKKYAHHYEVLGKYWPELAGLRRALLQDFNNFVIKDPKLLHSFMRELMLKRTRLEKLSKRDALLMLKERLEGKVD